MKGSMRAAAAIGIGYVLGRHRKFRTAAVMAAGMTIGGTTVGALVMKRGMKMLGSTDAIQKVAPQLGELADVVRGDLVAAGKAAATAAVSNQLDSLTDSLHDRAERLRNPAATVAEGVDKATETADKATEAGRSAARTGGGAATGTAKRAGAAAGGTASRVTGRGRAADPDVDEADVDDNYEADDYDDRDDYADDDYRADDRTDEADTDRADEADTDRADEADTRPPRRSATRRRSPVSRARG
jgi:hypothetical protein